MTRALLTGFLLGAGLVATYALGRYAERRSTTEQQRRILMRLYPATSGLDWEQTGNGLWRLRAGGAL